MSNKTMERNVTRNKLVLKMLETRTASEVSKLLHKRYPKLTESAVGGIHRREQRRAEREEKQARIKARIAKDDAFIGSVEKLQAALDPNWVSKAELKGHILGALNEVKPELNALFSKPSDEVLKKEYLTDMARSAFKGMLGVEPGLHSVTIEIVNEGELHMEFTAMGVVEETMKNWRLL